MADTVIVIAIVGVVLVLGMRSFYRTLTGKDEGRGCGGVCPRPECSGHTPIEKPSDFPNSR